MSYATEEEDITRKYGHSHMAIAISKNTSELRNNVGQRFILKVYVPASWSGTIEKARVIARREGRSLSDLIRDLLRDYVRIHEPGNPQLPLTKFTGESHDPNECAFEGCGAPAAYLVHLDGRSMKVCMGHLKLLRREHKALGWRRL